MILPCLCATAEARLAHPSLCRWLAPLAMLLRDDPPFRQAEGQLSRCTSPGLEQSERPENCATENETRGAAGWGRVDVPATQRKLILLETVSVPMSFRVAGCVCGASSCDPNPRDFGEWRDAKPFACCRCEEDGAGMDGGVQACLAGLVGVISPRAPAPSRTT